MNEKKIIISIKEAETLIHKGSLILKRNDLSRRNNTYRVVMFLRREINLSEDTKCVILYSDVEEFEIYSFDEIVFVNHFRVPTGMLKVINRAANIESIPEEKEADYVDNGIYLKLRNGLLGMFHHKYEMQAVVDKEYRIEGILESFFDLSDLRKKVISEIVKNEEFPTMEVKGKPYMSDLSKRIVWWGVFLGKNYFEKDVFDRLMNSDNKKADAVAEIKSDDNKIVSESDGQLTFSYNNNVDERNVSSEKEKSSDRDKKHTAADKEDKLDGSDMNNQKTDKANARIKEIRVWLGKFLEIVDSDASLLNSQLATMPKEIKEEADFIVGYCLAASYYEKYLNDELVIKKQYSLVEYQNKDELYSWVSFFVSLFRQDMHQLYFIKPLKTKVNQIERLAYGLSENGLTAVNKEAIDVEQIRLKRDDLIVEYFDLMKGIDGRVKTEIVSKNEAKNVFKNNLFQDQLPLVGMEKKSLHDDSGPIKNFCMLSDNHVSIKYKRPKDGEIVFYLDKHSKMNDEMREHKYKVKELYSLIDADKKVLVIFNHYGRKPDLLSVYAELLNGDKESKIEKAVLVLLTDTRKEDIYSIEFDNEVKQHAKVFEQLLRRKIDTIVKDIYSSDNTEVKRNLKNALNEYNINQIEVLDENFTNEMAGWLLNINSKYFIEKENQNYYSFFN